MNIANNKKRRESQKNIEKIFVELIQEKELNEITVTDICKIAKINRTTFYNNYLDIYDLADKIKEKLEQDVFDLYQDERIKGYNSHDFSKIFKLVKDNQLFFKTYFKLEFDSHNIITNDYKYDTKLSKEIYNDEFIDYHMEFFKAGFNAILKKWLNNGCKESVEDMCKILLLEYNGKLKS